jgi:hypothetical protein
MKTVLNLTLLVVLFVYSSQIKTCTQCSKHNYYEIIARNSGKCLTVPANTGGQVVQSDCANNDRQKFRIHFNDDDSAVFISKADGSVLDIFESNSNNETKVISYNYHGGNNQRFILESNKQDHFYIHPVFNKGACIDVYGGKNENGVNIIEYGCHGGANQQFHLRLVFRQ